MNRQKIIDVLKGADGLCEGQLQNGARCVVGELLYAMGFTPEQIMEMSPGLYGSQRADRKARRALAQHYDLNKQGVDALMDLNDTHVELAGELANCNYNYEALTNQERLLAVLFALEHWDDYVEAYV